MTTTPTIKGRRLPFILSITIFIILGISGGILNIAWTYMQDMYAVDVSAIGILLLFATVGALIATISSGTLLIRFRFSWIIVIAMLIVALGMFAISVVTSWIALLIVIFIAYSGRGLLDAGLNYFFSENYDTSAMNWLHASWGVGLTIAPTIMTFILIDLAMPWQTGYIAVGFAALIMCIILALTINQWNIAPEANKTDINVTEISDTATLLETLRQPLVLLSMLIFFLYGGIEIGTGQLANTLLVEGRQLSQNTAGLWLSLYWGSFTIGRILLGWIALRVRDKTLLRSGMLLAVVGALLLAWNLTEIMDLIGLISIGMGLSGIFPTLISRTPQRVGRRFSTQTIGFQIGAAGLGASILPGLIALLSENFSLEWIGIGILINTILLIVTYEVTQS
ncbi:MAG: MFS transporter [Phototrophicaceae bacterium]